jgi:ribonuclease-3
VKQKSKRRSEEELLKLSSSTRSILENLFHIHIRQEQLFKMACMHRSYIFEENAASIVSNERLEFLGDAVLELLSSEFLYAQYPQSSEGDLTHVRSYIVCTKTLALFAERLHMDELLLVGKGEKKTRLSERLLASVFEAFIGACYLDQGITPTRLFLMPLLLSELNELQTVEDLKDPKTVLQEYVQAKNNTMPIYQLVAESGPIHKKEFTVEVSVNSRVVGTGLSKTKQDAEREAARNALHNKLQWIPL